MDAQPKDWLQQKLLDALAGFELGVLGGLLMLGWCMLIVPLIGQPWWTIPNLLASKYFNASDLGSGPGFPTLAGGAFQLVTAALVGAFAGFLVPIGRLSGIAVAISWYVASYLYLWRRIAPLASAYSPQVVLMIGFFIFGSTLGYHWTLSLRREAARFRAEGEVLETRSA